MKVEYGLRDDEQFYDYLASSLGAVVPSKNFMPWTSPGKVAKAEQKMRDEGNATARACRRITEDTGLVRLADGLEDAAPVVEEEIPVVTPDEGDEQ